jgi:hypothetical protein
VSLAQYTTWTNGRIKRRHKTLQAQTLKLVSALCDAGFGALKPNEMRVRRAESPLFDKYLTKCDEMSDLRSEAQMRYGPGFLYMEQLK